MKLKQCLELADICGLISLGEAVENVRLHSPMLMKYEHIASELHELYMEVLDGEYDKDLSIDQVADDMGLEWYYKTEEDKKYGCRHLRKKVGGED
jgi:hypothetical protein